MNFGGLGLQMERPDGVILFYWDTKKRFALLKPLKGMATKCLLSSLKFDKTHLKLLQNPGQTSICICKKVATKYFLLGDLKLNLFGLGFQTNKLVCRLIGFAASLLNLSRKKKEERFLVGLKWELWLGNSMLDSINSLQKQDIKTNLHTNL